MPDQENPTADAAEDGPRACLPGSTGGPAGLPTVRRLDDAIFGVLGKDVVGLMRSKSAQRMLLHEAACMQAFVDDRRDEDADVLRAMQAHVRKTGIYPFDSFDGTEIL